MSETFSPSHTSTLSRLGVLSQALSLTGWARIANLQSKLNDLAFMPEMEVSYHEQAIVKSLTK